MKELFLPALRRLSSTKLCSVPTIRGGLLSGKSKRSVKEEKMARFPTIEGRFFAKVLSWDDRFRSPAAVATLLDQFATGSGRSLIGYSAPHGLLHEIPLAEVPCLFKPETSRNAHDFLFGDPRLSMNVRWEDPDFVEATDSSHRIAVMVRMQDDTWDFARQQFLLLCKLTGVFWGELNETAVTGKTTFSGPNQHMCCLPLFGSMNFLGPDYSAYLGPTAIGDAGFTQVESFSDGILTRICTETSESFAERQRIIRDHLGGDRVFKDWRPDNRPQFVTRERQVVRYRSELPPTEFSITAHGLKKRPLTTKTK